VESANCLGIAKVATVANETLERFLTQCGLDWSVITWEQHVRLSSEWETSYGNFHQWLHYKQGAKAQFEYSCQAAQVFLIVPFLGDVVGPHSIKKPGPRKSAYQCAGSGTVPDVSTFAEIDFFVAPDDWSWTMMHTHEDCGFGGPYFIRKDWLGPPGRPQPRGC
jgi:hypothetical protein